MFQVSCIRSPFKVFVKWKERLAWVVWLCGPRQKSLCSVIYNGKHVECQLFVEPSTNGPLLHTSILYDKVCYSCWDPALHLTYMWGQVNNSWHKESSILWFYHNELSQLVLRYLFDVSSPEFSWKEWPCTHIYNMTQVHPVSVGGNWQR